MERERGGVGRELDRLRERRTGGEGEEEGPNQNKKRTITRDNYIDV